MNLGSDNQQKARQQRDSVSAELGEARQPEQREFESLSARNEDESPAETEYMMEAICEWKNLREAIGQVKANKGSAGIDGVKTDELPGYRQLIEIREQLLSGTYKALPVRRVEIRNREEDAEVGYSDRAGPDGAASGDQVLQKRDRTFSESSFGFRPGRSAHEP
jgi:RNA-directed DNA polymerase